MDVIEQFVETAMEKNGESSMVIDNDLIKLEEISDNDNVDDVKYEFVESITDSISDYSIKLETKALDDAVSEALLMRSVETATEKNGESSMVIDNDLIKLEEISDNDNNVDDVKDEFVESITDSISDYSIKLETKPLDDAVSEALLMRSSILEEKLTETQESVKSENIMFECKICFETFSDENAINEHIMMMHHKQRGVSDFVVRENRSDDPRSHNTRCGTSHIADTKSVQAPRDDARTGDAASAAPLLAGHVTNNEKQVQPTEEADETEESKQIFEIDSDELNMSIENNRLEKMYDECTKMEKTTPTKSLTKTRKLTTTCKSNSPNNDNVSIDFSYQRTNQNEVSPVKSTKTITKQLIIKIDKLNLSKIQQSGRISLNYHVNKERKKLSANNSHSYKDKYTETNQFTCDLCQSVFKCKSTLVRHLRAHTDSKYICKIGQYRFKHDITVVRDTKTHSNTIAKSFSCRLCKYKCAQSSRLRRHMRTHTGKKPFSCKLCEYKCSYSSRLNNHMRTHTGEKPFSCKLCEYKCSYSSHLNVHMRNHTGEKPFSCKLCEYKCLYSSHLNVHMRSHTGEKPFSCKLCEYKFSNKSNLVKHMTTHTGEKPFSCELCEYKCSNSSDLNRHMRIHTGEKPFSCKLCENKFSVKSSLVIHMRTHTGEKPFSCKLCEYKCSNKSSLVIHMRIHSGEKPFSCKSCQNKFSSKSSFVVHMRTHSGEKPFSCKLCEKNFSVKSNLVIHLQRIHMGEKPLSCKLCEYKCARKGDLVGHMRTHTDDKPFSCKFCEYKCSVAGDLIVHVKTHPSKKHFL